MIRTRQSRYVTTADQYSPAIRPTQPSRLTAPPRWHLDGFGSSHSPCACTSSNFTIYWYRNYTGSFGRQRHHDRSARPPRARGGRLGVSPRRRPLRGARRDLGARLFRVLGSSIAANGIAGLLAAGVAGSGAIVATVGAVLPGALLLAFAYWRVLHAAPPTGAS
jgi:hypothetical protein